MNDNLGSEKAARLAGEYFGNGYHCAEAVVRAVLESRGEEADAVIPYSTAFGGGFGKTFNHACGVVSGCLLVIGHRVGRRRQGDSWEEAARLGRATVERFEKLHGTCNCGELRRRFGEEEQMDFCRELVRQGAAGLAALLDNEPNDESRQPQP